MQLLKCQVISDLYGPGRTDSGFSLDVCMPSNQGCQMVCFQTQNPNLGKFWRFLHWQMLVYFMDTWSMLRCFVIFYGHLV
jgi:hypothetical protein